MVDVTTGRLRELANACTSGSPLFAGERHDIAACIRAVIAARELVDAYDEIDEVDASTTATEARNDVMKNMRAIVGRTP